jgi:phenylacetate-coenzyme A ligase PaaK-like adenylate-forming protein
VSQALDRREQARFGFKPLEAIEGAQRARLRRIVAHAYETVPYYGETMQRLGLQPDDLHTAADLARLPVIERHDIQRDPSSSSPGPLPSTSTSSRTAAGTRALLGRSSTTPPPCSPAAPISGASARS